MDQSTELATIAKKLNENVVAVIGSKILGFEKAYLVSSAIIELKSLLSPKYMKPIMALQGNRLGFKTDKDSAGGYSEEQVKNCLVEAVLMGVQPHGNQFNIIAGNTYLTKEGFGYLLNQVQGLSYEIIFELPRIKDDSKSAAVVAKVNWTLNGETKERSIDIPIKMNAYMGTDAVLGKATRKARAWLYNTINNSEIADGDATDNDAKMKSAQFSIVIDKESDRVLHMIEDSKTIVSLEELQEELTTPELVEAYATKHRQLGGKLP